jgi:hypothetical protein
MAVNPDAGWDLSIKDRNGQLVLVVEVKRKTNASPDWAAAFRRNILAHGSLLSDGLSRQVLSVGQY